MKTNVDSLHPKAADQGLPLSASLFTAFLCILFGANAVAIKISLAGLGVFTTAGVRFAFGAITIYLWARYTGKKLAVTVTQFRRLTLLAIIFFVQLSLFYSGINRTTASHGTLIVNVLPFVVMILAHFFIPGDRISPRKISGLILGFSGVLVLFFDNIAMDRGALQGDLLIVLAVLIWGCHVVYIKKIIATFDPIQITLYPMLMAAPLFLISGFMFDGEMVRYIDISITQSMLYQIFVTASFGMVAWNTMIRKFGATALHSFVFIMPIAGVFLGVVLLDEPLTLNLIVSIVLVVAGLLVLHSVRHNRIN